MNQYTGLEIAVIGLSGRFPGADTIHKFWEMVQDGRDCISTFSNEEAMNEGETELVCNDPAYVRSNAHLSNKHYFDYTFFNYRPDEAALMDPQIRIFHECCWLALEDAGYASNRQVNIGLYAAGTLNVPWVLHAEVANRQGLVDDFTAAQLRDVSFLSSLIAYRLNLKGPAIYLQTACSSSLVAIHEACNSVLLGECSIALAGGVNIKHYSKKGYTYKEGMIHSRDGKCRPFDSHSAGTVNGEGAGVVVLKKLKDALRDGDNIYAIIKGSAINNDGNSKVGFTAPSVSGQSEVIKRAHRMARIDSQSITYVEAHGTATELGDAIEVEALNKAFGNHIEKNCALGAVKSNIGHLDSAAGVAGFIKTVLAIHHRQLPPGVHFKEPNPRIDFKNGPFYVNTTLKEWNNAAGPLRAGVSSFGIGGTNAHIVLEEAPTFNTGAESRPFQLITLSAKTPSGLENNTIRFIEYLQSNTDVSLPDIAYTLQTGRERFRFRQTVVCENREEAIRLLTSGAWQQQAATNVQEDLQHVIFLFSGQGAQYANMCRGLYLHEKAFRHYVDDCLGRLKQFSTLDFHEVLFPGDDSEKDNSADINNTKYAQPLLFVIEYSLALMLMQWGIRPGYMIGHSIGEYVAACISGVLSLNDALRLVARRGELMSSVEQGCMLAVDLPEETLQPLLLKYPKIDLAVVNTENSLVVAGSQDDISEFESVLVNLEYNCKRLHTSHAFHSYMMDAILDEFSREFSTVTIHPPSIPYISNISGDFVQFEQVRKPAYWSTHLRLAVQFCKGAQTLLQLGNGLFIEVGPGRSLCNYISGNTLKSNRHTVINLVRQAKQQVNDEKYLVEKLGLLWLNGIDIQWNEYYTIEKRKKVSLPGYCFDQLPLTTDFDLNRLLLQTLNGTGHEQKKQQENYIHVRDWKKTILPNEATELKEQQSVFLVFRGNESFSASVIDRLVSLGQHVIDIKPGKTFQRIEKDQFEVDLAEPAHLAQLFHSLFETGIIIEHIIYCVTLNEQVAAVQFNHLQTGLRDGYLGISYIAKAIAGSRHTANIQVTVIGNQLATVTEEDVIDPIKAIVHAPVRIAPSEIMNVTCKVIDIPYPLSKESIPGYLLKIENEIFFEPEEPFVAYRMGQRWVPFFDNWNSNQKTGSGITIKNDGVYVIVGGMGGVGFTLAKDIAHRYQPTLAIVYRSAFPARGEWNDWLIEKGEADAVSQQIRQLMEMERAGSSIALYQANITQQEEVRELIHTLQKKYSKINGIIWCAGEIDYGGIILNRSKEDFISYSSSKVHGLLLMQQLLDFASLDFIAMFSSVGNVIYQVKFGQVGYNAGNEFLEHYAAYAKHQFGIHAFTINWCDWMDVGLTIKAVRKEFPLADIKTINSKIAHAIYPKDGIRIFYECLENKAPVYTIYPGDLLNAIAERRLHVKEMRQDKPPGEITIQGKVINHRPEDQLVTIYTHFFGTKVSVTDNFFELGGDSLKAMSLVARINQQLCVRLSISDMYSCPTIQELLVKLAVTSSATTEKSNIPKVEEKEYYVTSSEQKRMYFLQSVNEQSVLYNETEILVVHGVFDKDKAERIFDLLIERHESLRSVFVLKEDGVLCQRIEKDWQFSIEELENTESQTDEIIEAFIRPFDLSAAPFLRVGIMNRGPLEYILVIDSHHIVMDGVSRLVLRDEFNTLYGGHQLPQLDLQYKDYAAWQQSSLQQGLINKQREYWLQEFAEEPLIPELPTDFQRPPVKSHQGDFVRWELTAAQTASIRVMAASAGTTVFTVLLSAINILLSKLSNQEDITIGIPVAGRQHADLEQVIGMFVNTLAVRNYPQGEKRFRDFLAEVKVRSVAGFENQLLPFEELVNLLQVQRDSSRNPLFDVMFVYQHYEESKNEPSDITIRPGTISHTSSRFDLTLLAVEENDHIFLRLLYSTELFKKESVQRFVDCFGKIISAILTDHDIRLWAIDITSETEKQLLLTEFNNTLAEEVQGKTVIGLFYDQVTKTPQNRALMLGQQSISYGQLGNLVATIAWQVTTHSGNTKSCIGLLFSPGIEMVAAMLGVMKAGCIFVPLSPDAPDERNDFIITDCDAALILTDAKTYEQKQQQGFLQKYKKVLLIKTGETDAAAPVAEGYAVSPADLVYINYTSGTSGKPKGVKVTHANLTNYALWNKAYHQLTQQDVALQLVSYHFDGFGANCYPALLSGATVIMVSEEHKLDAVYIAGLIRQERVTNLALLPGFYAALLEQLEAGEKPGALRFIVLAGERAGAALIKKHMSILPAVALDNEYGPTETTIAATHHHGLQEENPAVIGKPLWNTSIYILGKGNDLLPAGTWGEICISGAGVAAGYLNNDPLTLEKFVNDPFVPERKMYRTGDLGRWRPDGSLEMNGRIDDQVKVRGYRIEPAEIESCLTGFNNIKQAVVVAGEKQGQKYLVAYYVGDYEIPVHEIKNFLSVTLPAYMVPEIYIHIDVLPYTLNGKIDKKKLPSPLLTPALEKMPPVTREEEVLVHIWSAVLGIDNIGTTDNFFSIGGDSIKSIQICSRLRGKGYATSVKDIFTCQTIQRLAARLKQVTMVADESLVTGTVTLSPVQRWFFKTFNVQQNHFCQSVLLQFPKGITAETVITIFQQLLLHHDALRMVCVEKDGESMLVTTDLMEQVYLQEFDMRNNDNESDFIIAESDRLRTGIDLEKGPLVRLGLFHTKDDCRLLIIIHHLVIDAVSWRILFEDIQTLLEQTENRQQLVLPLKTSSWQHWSQQMWQHEQREIHAQTASYWKAVVKQQAGLPQRDYIDNRNRFSDVNKVSVELDKAATRLLLTNVHQAFNTHINDILLTALWLSVKKKYNLQAIFVDMEGHGRENIASSLDVTRTVGWFTTIYPVLLQGDERDWSVLIREIKDNLRSIPNHGMDYLMLAYPLRNNAYGNWTNQVQSLISFNYLGQFDTDVDSPYFSVAGESTGQDIAPEANRKYDWDISGMIVNGGLTLQLAYSSLQYKQETVVNFLHLYREYLQEIIHYCSARQKIMYSPFDFTFNKLSVSEADRLQQEYDLSDVYPLSPMQEGMLFHSLLEVDSSNYFQQMTYTIQGMLDIAAVEQSMNYLVERYDTLRTLFLHNEYDIPLQVVLKNRKIDFHYKDIREEGVLMGIEQAIGRYQQKDRARTFDLRSDLLMRLMVLQVLEDRYVFIWSHHHVLMDGWCMAILVNEFLKTYSAIKHGRAIVLPPVTPYSTYIKWLHERKQEPSATYWSNYLAGYDRLASLPAKELIERKETGYRLASQTFIISKEQTNCLNAKAGEYMVTVNTLLHTAWGILLAKYNNVSDVVFGTVVSGRPAEIEGIEKMVGLFINTIPVRVQYSQTDDTGSLIQRMQQQALESEQFQYQPLFEIQALSEPGRGLLNHIMVIEDYPLMEEIKNAADPNAQQEFTVTGVQIFEQANYDIVVIVIPGEEIHIKIDYNENVYEKEMIERAGTHLLRIVSLLNADRKARIANFEIITEPEKNRIFNTFNKPGIPFTGTQLFVHAFEEQVALSPDAVAVMHDHEQLTYRQLNEKANQLAAFLHSKAEKQSNIPVLMDPSIPLLISMIGIFKAGMVYVPLNTDLPLSRIMENLLDLDAHLLLMNSSYMAGEEVFYNRLTAETNIQQLVFYDGPGQNADANVLTLFKTCKTANSISENIPVLFSETLLFYDSRRHYTGDELNTKIRQLGMLMDTINRQQQPVGLLLANPVLKIIAGQALAMRQIPFRLFDPLKEITNETIQGVSVLISENTCNDIADTLFWESRGLEIIILLDSYNIHTSKKEASFKKVWNHVAARTSEAINDYGWLSSYTGAAFSIPEMQEYVQNFKTKLAPWLNLRSRVLEIGCGHGILLFELAPQVAYYHATDPADIILEKNRERIQRTGITNTGLQAIAASEIGQTSEKDFDVIVCSSVVHYFPDTIYLEQVIKDAIGLLKEEGIIYLDDLMDLGQKDNFIASVQEYKKEHPQAKAKTDWSNDLFIGAAFFDFLQAKYPEIISIDITRKTGAISNELTRFRYDVLLKVNKTATGVSAQKRGNKERYVYEDIFTKQVAVNDITGPSATIIAELPGEIATHHELQTFQKSNIGIDINANDTCYIIYTSGTTGKPKGVMIHHAGMINHLYAKVNDLAITANDVIAQTAPVSFDISIWQLLACLIKGGSTCIIEREKVLQPPLLLNDLTHGGVTIFESVPSLLVNMLETVQEEQLAVLGKLKWMILTGEQLSVSLVKNWFAVFPHTRLLNAYGPTEASDDITHYLVEYPSEGQLSVPVGKPVQNMHIYILDNNLHLCPVGVRGEICVAGIGVGKGYWKDTDKTRKAFIANCVEESLPNTCFSMIYKTGDVGYFQENGNVVCLGRTDSQVKIRGFRIELGEIEARMAEYPLIHESVVISDGKEDDKYLAAYFVASVEIDIDVLKKFLLQKLPAYMVPAYYVQLKKIPVTVNGKLNRKALPDPQAGLTDEYVLPANAIEAHLVTIWAEILKIEKEKISTHTSFFDLGGHSLKATVLVNKMQKQFGLEVPLKEIFDKQNIRDISDYIITVKQIEDQTAPVNELIEISI